MRIQVVAFARLRELLEPSEPMIELPAGSRVRDAWELLARQHAGLHDLARSTRIARNGSLAALDDVLAEGDELALLPPVGGG